MEPQKGTGYKIESILLLESFFRRKDYIDFEGSAFDNIIDVQNESNDTEAENRFVVNISFSYIAKQEEDSVFEIKVKMAGVFERQGETQVSLENFKKINAPAIIYPFLREHVASLTLKAGIGNVLLPAVNFKI